MALSLAKLETEFATMLTNLTSDSAPDAASEWGAAWGRFFKNVPAGTGATWNGAPVLAAGVDAGVAAMVAAMTFANDGTGDAVITAGLLAFWVHLQANSVSYFAGSAPDFYPPGMANIESNLGDDFATNNDPDITLVEAADNLAATVYADAGLNGTLKLLASPFTPSTII